MLTDKNSYIDIQKEITELTRNIVSKDELENFTQHIESKISNFNPTLMIYGTYNAGKSTLLNALFGKEEMAKTGDAPETKEIHEYEYNGYTIFDTPGMNARNEDDVATAEHLEKSEVIVFVISNNGSLEEEYVYQKISEVVKANKPIIIVLNNKNGIDPESIEAKQSMIKVGENLRKIGDRNSIDKIETKVSLCMVNAKTALKGKLENKKLILKKSNIVQLEIMIEKVLEELGNNEVINTLNIYIQNFIDSTTDRIDSKIDNIELQKLEELITYLEKFKQSSEIKLKNNVSKKMPSMVESITSGILNQNQSDIDTYINTTFEDVINQIENVSININEELSIKIDNFSNEFKNITAEYEDIDISIDTDESVEESSYIPDDIKDKIGETLKDKRVIEEGAKKILAKAKDWLPKDVMFGKGPAWMSKAAGKVAIVLSIAIEGYNMYDANQEYNKMIENERNRVLGAKNSAESIVDNIQSSLYAGIDDMLADTFNTLIIEFKDESRKLSSDNRSLLDTKESLRSISNRFF